MLQLSIIFATLSRSTTILSRRLYASLFILLFMSVQVIKDTHIHQVTPRHISTIEKSNYHFSDPVASCAICDYDFAKDKDHVYSSPVITIISTMHEAFLTRDCRQTFSTAKSSGGRAPPQEALS